MQFSKKLLKSGLLDAARKSATFYTITDHLREKFGEKITIDLVDDHIMTVTSNGDFVGNISPANLQDLKTHQAFGWTYHNDTHPELDLTPDPTYTYIER